MTNYTEKEMAMLKAFYNASVDICGECNEDNNMSYMNAKDLQEVLSGSMQEIGGVMSSLVDKAAIVDCMESYRGAKLNDFALCDMKIAAFFSAQEE